MQQYYAHPQNQFWRILGMLWRQDLIALPYAERCTQALAHGLGIWDVYASCQRQGSLDSAITNATVNDHVGRHQKIHIVLVQIQHRSVRVSIRFLISESQALQPPRPIFQQQEIILPM